VIDDSHTMQNWFLFHFSSIKIYQEHTLFAAIMGKGIVRKHLLGDWENICEGLPLDIHINRLHIRYEHIFACTNKGLFRFANECWNETELTFSCYQYKDTGAHGMAATSYGLWYKDSGCWKKAAYSHNVVYDFLYFPQYIILALDCGIAVYDRYVSKWAEFQLDTAVTSLAIYEGHVIGTTEHGELLYGDKKGSFEKVRFENMFLFSVIRKNREVFACTDRGLYKLTYIQGRITLFAIKLGFPVTDIDANNDSLYLATLFEGVHKMERPLV